MQYTIGWPFWRVLGRCGAQLCCTLQVYDDPESFRCDCPQLPDFMLDASSLKKLLKEAHFWVNDFAADELYGVDRDDCRQLKQPVKIRWEFV